MEISTAAIVFAGIGMIGLLLLLVAVFFDGDSDVDFDIDAGDFDAASIIGWLSFKKLGPGLMVGGVAGCCIVLAGLPLVIAIIASLLSGGAIAYFMSKVIEPLLTPSGRTGTYSIEDLVFKIGTVTTSIPKGQDGQISIATPDGGVSEFRAASADKEAIPRNTSVIVVEVDSANNGRLLVVPNKLT